MTCPDCAAHLPGAPPLCPRCGYPILEEHRTFRLSFDGDMLEFAGWLALGLVSALLVVPLAWTASAFARWFCRNLRMRGPETVAFTGTGPQILGWAALLLLVEAPLALSSRHIPPMLSIAAVLCLILLIPLIHLAILRWIARNLQLSGGPPLRFAGTYGSYLFYHLLIGISGITIIGWAWVLAAYYRWLAERTCGEGIAIRCDAAGWDVLWRSVAVALGSLLIVSIPWLWLWYARWLVGCITITRGVTTIEHEWA